MSSSPERQQRYLPLEVDSDDDAAMRYVARDAGEGRLPTGGRRAARGRGLVLRRRFPVARNASACWTAARCGQAWADPTSRQIGCDLVERGDGGTLGRALLVPGDERTDSSDRDGVLHLSYWHPAVFNVALFLI